MDGAGDRGDDGGAAGKAPPEPSRKPENPGRSPVPCSGEGEKPQVKRVMKSPYQLEVLEKTYAAEQYPSETLRAELSVKLGLSDRQLQMWFCHRRLKDRKAPAKRQLLDEEVAAPVMATPPVLPPAAPLREEGPVLGIEFDPLPPGAFGAPIVPDQQKQPMRFYDTKIFSRHDPKLTKAAAFLPSREDPFVPNAFAGKRKRKSTVGNSLVHPHDGSRAVHEYQFLPEQPRDTHERTGRSHFYDTPVEASNSRISSLSLGSHFLHGAEQVAPSYTFQGQIGSALSTQQGRPHVVPAVSTDYEMDQSTRNVSSAPVEGQFAMPQIAGFENPLSSSERRAYDDEEAYRVNRKRKHNKEAKVAKGGEANDKRIRKELEKQDILRRKREEHMRKEMERLDRERRKEEKLMREKQREEERFQRDQRREHKRTEKFLQKQSRRAEKLRQKEELRREKEAARQKAANERATARRAAREYMELLEDERLELMELAAQSKGLPSMLYLASDTLRQLDSFRGMLSQFPTGLVRLKVPFSIKPWTESEDNVGKLLMVWKFLITFADVLGLSSITLDEFVQSLHDYNSRFLGELHVALLKSIIKDIEDIARVSSVALGANQSSSANPEGGHPQIVEGAYAWGFNIRSWQRHLNFLTWPEILRQFALSAGFGPQLKKRNSKDVYYCDDNEGQDGNVVISALRNGSAALNAAALMKERGYTHRRGSRHRLTPGTVKFAAFHVLSLEGSKGLTILEVAEKIQKSGLRDLTTSKTPEASVGAALSRDTKLFERTAPSTYCVKTPYRKDPADSEAVLSGAREKIRAFQNALSERDEAEKKVDDAERDEDSECDDEPNGNENIEVKVVKDPIVVNKARDGVSTALGNIKTEAYTVVNSLTPPSGFTKSGKSGSLYSLDKPNLAGTSSDSTFGASSDYHEARPVDAKDTEIDESSQGESWIQGLAEGDYCDLSVEERLNALTALIGVATEGNSIRAILEERLEAANALKKKMWAEAQLDKRRLKEEFANKMQYNSYMSMKADINQENNTAEGTPIPVCNLDKDNSGNLGAVNNVEFLDQQKQINVGNIAYERSGIRQEISVNPDTSSVRQYVYADKTQSQLKSYIGHKAEQFYAYRSLPLGQDRGRNRYWLFSTSATPNDPSSGRIFFESRDGYWRLIDSDEVFDTLVASLDTRGIREAHLHLMLQTIEPTFKEAIRRKKCANIEYSAGRFLKNGATEIIRPNCSNELGSPSSALSGVIASDSLVAYSDSFKIEIGHNNAEKTAITKRADGFLKWMWRECYNNQSTCAMKYGKKRCSELIKSCNYCYQIYLTEEKHCSSCHKTFKSIHNFSEHTSQCEEKQRTDPNWKMQISDYSIPVGLRLLKLLLATIEVSVPSEALQPFWTDGYRKSWGVKVHSASSVEEIFQMLTLLEGAVRRDYLASYFETTTELLNSNTKDFAVQNSVAFSGSAAVLPWVPDTAAAVALRLLDLDSAISFMLHQKTGSNEEQEAGDFTKLPWRYTVAKNTQEMEPLEFTGFNHYDGRWLTPNSGRRGRGRGSQGGSRGGRGRSRGGRVLRGIGSSSRAEFRNDNAVTYEKAPRKYTCQGHARGCGPRRGWRAVRPQWPSEGSARSIPKANLLGGFSMLSNAKPASIKESPQSSGAEAWGLDSRRAYVDDDENSSGSHSDQSEENEENGQPMDEEYDDQVADYSRDHIVDDETEDDDDNDVDPDGDGEGDENGEEDVDGEMNEDEQIGDDEDDDGDGVENAEEDDGATSDSSDYSE